MNKIFKVKRNSAGQSVVTSEIAKSHGRVLALAVAAAITSHSAIATSVYSTTTPEVKFDDKNTILIGSDLHVETETTDNSSNISIGNKSKFYDLSDSISIGNNNILGDQSTLNNGNQPVRAVAIGSENTVGHQSIGIGGGTVSNKPFSIAIGDTGGSASDATTATGFGSIAIGGNAKALSSLDPFSNSTSNIAIGLSSFTNAKEAIAFGYKANATHDKSVALGSNSVTEAPKSTPDFINNGIKYTFSGLSSAVVSIGDKTNGNNLNRQIVNVAAGRVSDLSTDAVNGSQLYAAISTLGNVSTSAKNILGGNAALAANGTISMTNIGGTGQNTIHDAIGFVNATAQTANNTANLIAATTYTFGIANEQAAAASNTGIADKWSTTTADSLTLGATSDLSVTTDGAGKVIYGLSDATKANITKAQTDAEKALADAKAADDKATAAKTAVDELKPVVEKNTAEIAKKADKTYVDAELAKKADQSALDATNDKLNALDNAAVKYDDPTAKDKVTLGGADGTTITNVKAGAISADSKDAVNGSQLHAVKVVADAAKAQSDANTADIARLDNQKADKTALEATNQTVAANKEAQDAKNAAQDAEIAKKADQSALDATNDKLNALDNQKADKTALEETNVKVKANADNIAKGFNVATADGVSVNYQLGDTVSILGSKNIDTKTIDGAVNVVLKDDITVKTMTVDGSSVGLSADGINAGDKKVINVANGEVSATSKDAVNGSQLHAVKVVADAAKAQSDANTADIARLDNQKADKTALEATNQTVAANKEAQDAKNAAQDAEIAKKADQSALDATNDKLNALDNAAVKYDDPTAKDKVTLGGADGTTITNVKAGAISANSTDAVNGSQLFDVYNYVNQGNDAMRQHIDTVEDKLQAGIAGSNASAALPQVRGNGKSMTAFGLGGFQDKGALAVGYSRSSDNGRTVFKAHLNADTENQIGGGIGLGFEW